MDLLLRFSMGVVAFCAFTWFVWAVVSSIKYVVIVFFCGFVPEDTEEMKLMLACKALVLFDIFITIVCGIIWYYNLADIIVYVFGLV